MTVTVDGFPGHSVRGREPEQRVIRDLLRRAAQGNGGVLLVEGERGIGKSALLRGAVDEAARQGFSLAAGAADPLGQSIPFFALRTALGKAFAQFTAVCPGHDAPDTPAWWISQMRAYLQQGADSGPALVCMDDVQWACPATLAALRTLPGALKSFPVAWVIGRSSTPRQDSGYLFDALERDGAARIGMAPLAPAAVAALLTDAFGAPPDRALEALAAEAGGNPSLLAELIGGLRDDNAVRLAEGNAALVPGRLPLRLHRVAREWLDGLSGPTQHLLLTTAVLGPAFRLEDAAELISETPAALLPVVEEATAAGIVAATENVFSFRHQLLRRAIGAMVPQAGRKALHRQYGHLLLNRGDLSAQAAGHLLLAAHPGDQASLTALDTAAARTSRSAPQAAADLALRALELTPAADPGSLARAAAAAEALVSAGRLEQAGRIAGETLAKPLPVVAEARLRCALSFVLFMRGQAGDAAAEAGRVLATPLLPPDLRDRATTAQLRALAELRDESAGPLAGSVLADPGRHEDYVLVAALAARAVSAWDEGKISEALDLFRIAARSGGAISADARDAQPLAALAAALIGLCQFSEAGEILNAADAQAIGAVPARATLASLRARLHLACGRVADADAAAHEALAAAQALGARECAATACRILALIALRRGDIADAVRHIACQAGMMPHDASLSARTETALVQARISEARDGAVAAVGYVRQASTGLIAHRALLIEAPATSAWLVRTALAAGDAELAAALARAAATLAADNPGYRAVSAAAAHSLGLFSRDPVLLAEAAGQHPDPWARASAAEDTAVIRAGQEDRDSVIRHLTQAVEVYEASGAVADMARVRRRLRRLGVRRRHWTLSPGQPASGWESLTANERQVSELAAQGLSNRQIAARMYVSASTVGCYLRQIFRKLELTSRVELTRVVMQRELSRSLRPDDAPMARTQAAHRQGC